MLISNFPNIVSAAKTIAHDNGAINRQETHDLLNFNINFTTIELKHVEKVLSVLSYETFETLCTGEEQEAKQITNLFACPQLLSDVLNALFNEVSVIRPARRVDV